MPFAQRNNPVLQRQLIRLGVFALIAVVVWFTQRNQPPQAPNGPAIPHERPAPAERNTREQPRVEAENNSSTNSLIMRGLVLRDEDGAVVYRGDIDLQPTLARIADDRKLRFSHDGTVFENRERRLPRQASGYYREWVVPTPGERGPGPQRLIVGDDGDVWYTSDHYRTFRKISYQFQ